ncbi:MAG: cytochrome c, partial [Bacteroidetes bacterium]|nr:cytochrome c [Bacteroidota bacterium]
PGMSPHIFMDEFGIRLPKRAVILVNTIHYASTPVDQVDSSHFRIYFKEREVRRTVKLINIGSGSRDATAGTVKPPLLIPPNQVKKFSVDVGLPVDLSIMYVMAHMHLLGKTYLAYATLPNGRMVPLVRINEWDFDWQEAYAFNPMLHLPAGTNIHVEGVYDNTVNNPNNPFNPPQTITSDGNMETTQEMLNLILLCLPYELGDERRIISQ